VRGLTRAFAAWSKAMMTDGRTNLLLDGKQFETA
jgi:hypothetical protein